MSIRSAIARIPLVVILLISVSCASHRQRPTYALLEESGNLPEEMAVLARRAIQDFHETDRLKVLDTLFRLQIVAGYYQEAIESLSSLRALRSSGGQDEDPGAHLQYEAYSRARLRQAEGLAFEAAFSQEMAEAFRGLDDRAAFDLALGLSYNLAPARRGLQEMLDKYREAGSVSPPDAIKLIRRYLPLTVYESILPLTQGVVEADDSRRYIIDDTTLVNTPDGATLSAVIVRSRITDAPRPAALMFNIYTQPDTNLLVAKNAAAHGYAGIVADPRGKRLSPDEIVPWEHEAGDTYSVIDWISKQPWNDGRVAMYGGSYGGFSSWAATKKMHPALKTIVAWVASIPGMGWPMHNNIFTNANYCWAEQITQSKLDAPEVCRDGDRWAKLRDGWYASGRPYREIDQVDGTANRLLHRWLDHPDYDEYWQSMVPFGSEFAEIDIPVLSITGYYDDAQISALHYLREHYRHNEHAEHYLVIGPYDHWTAQWKSAPVLRGYRLDPMAKLDTYALTFEWLDHVLRGGPRPALLEDRINFEVMGGDEWRHVASLEAACTETLTLYLSNEQVDDHYRLVGVRPAQPGFLRQEVDFADRATRSNDDFYPDPIVRDALEPGTGLVFVSDPFEETLEVNGAFGGLLRATVNKVDADIGVTLYELTPEGQYIHLSYYLGRVSYAKDLSRRFLLEPGKVESIPIERTYMTSRRLEKGSRLVAVLDVNKNPFFEINYGTGKQVADESIADATSPLEISWLNDSRLEIPISR